MQGRSLAFLAALSLLVAARAHAGGIEVAAIRNDSAAPVSVTLRSEDGTSVEFADVAPHTTTEPQPVPPVETISVVISSGQATPGAVKLHGGETNVIAVSASAPPHVDAPKQKKAERPSGNFW
jgi:hypothetical protein